MKDLGKFIIHIPARAGSKRVPQKNLRLLNGKPMIGYAIDCAEHFKDIADVYVNTDSDDITEYARSRGIKVYERDPELASDTASGDDFTIDIIRKLKPDTLMMISPVCPLIDHEIVQEAIEVYRNSKESDTLISVTETKMQTVVKGEFINIEPKGPLAASQDNPTVQTCNWAVTIWDSCEFEKNYNNYKGGYCGTNRILYPIDPIKAIKVSYEKDFEVARAFLKIQNALDEKKNPEYWTQQK